MDAIAQTRNLTREQLEDRIVPDCGFDSQGDRWFNYGNDYGNDCSDDGGNDGGNDGSDRQFQVLFHEEMKLSVQEWRRDASGERIAGKCHANLPRPNAREDQTKAIAVQAEWKLLKQQVSSVLKQQIPRLEQAMIQGRRWSIPEFTQFLFQHPLLKRVVCRLIWGLYDRTGTLQETFRIAEDGSFADIHDDGWSFATVADAAAMQLGIVHPAQLS
jgi:Domain of unknown function (DUF4132)